MSPSGLAILRALGERARLGALSRGAARRPAGGVRRSRTPPRLPWPACAKPSASPSCRPSSSVDTGSRSRTRPHDDLAGRDQPWHGRAGRAGVDHGARRGGPRGVATPRRTRGVRRRPDAIGGRRRRRHRRSCGRRPAAARPRLPRARRHPPGGRPAGSRRVRHSRSRPAADRRVARPARRRRSDDGRRGRAGCCRLDRHTCAPERRRRGATCSAPPGDRPSRSATSAAPERRSTRSCERWPAPAAASWWRATSWLPGSSTTGCAAAGRMS